jgi:UDP-2-acetamido-2,6-beta-L-arabino-hexul-4-ose reductase
MKTVLVTGSRGFIGKNLLEALSRQKKIKICTFDVDDDISKLESSLIETDIVYHLAGVNRPENEEEFESGHAGLTQSLVSLLGDHKKFPSIVMSSSIQAELDNPYGVSKKKAENILFDYSKRTGAPVYIYRLTNVFGKWCRPNYNSVVATFCHNISHGLDITISDVNKEIKLIYIDDVISSFLGILKGDISGVATQYFTVKPTYRISLGDLAKKIYQLRDIRKSLVIPDLSDHFMKCLYATYLSYIKKDDFSYELDQKMDDRGVLAELIKSNHFGQIFVSKTHEGVIRGNHYHNSKIEKFCVLKGKALIKFRHILSDEVLSYHVSGEKFEVVDIPPGYTHSIQNLSGGEMIVLFWADQIFDPQNPDTYYNEV